LKNSIADEFEFMDYVSNRQEESLMKLASHLKKAKNNKLENRNRNKILYEKDFRSNWRKEKQKIFINEIN